MRFLSALCLAAVAVSWGQVQLPDAPAKARVAKICGTCHEIETVIASRRTKTGWQHMVDDMVDRGAEGSEDDMAAITDYLAIYFGKVNVNTAAVGELQKALGIPERESRAIVTYREQNGKIKDFDELVRIPGVDAEKLRSKRSCIAFSQ
jgi:competence protein ComEA